MTNSFKICETVIFTHALKHLNRRDFLHSKHNQVKTHPEKGPLGSHSIPRQNDSEFDHEDPDWDHPDHIPCLNGVIYLTIVQVIFDSERSVAPTDFFPG